MVNPIILQLFIQKNIIALSKSIYKVSMFNQLPQDHRNSSQIFAQSSIYQLPETSLQFQCPICLEQYNQSSKYPMIICPRLHTVCQECTFKTVFKSPNKNRQRQQQDSPKCPQCNTFIFKENVVKFRHLADIKRTFQDIKNQGSRLRRDLGKLRQREVQVQERLIQEREKNQWILMMLDRREKQIAFLKSQIQILNVEILNLRNRMNERPQLTQPQQYQLKQITNPYIAYTQRSAILKPQQQAQPQQSDPIQIFNNGNNNKNNPNPTPNPSFFKSLFSLSPPKPQLKSIDWIDHSCTCANNVSFLKNTITAQTAAFLFGKQEISLQYYSFSCTFTSIKSLVSIGIINREYRGKSSLLGVSDWIYYKNDGGYRNGIGGDGGERCNSGTGFKVGDYVCVEVILRENRIDWKVNHNVVFSLKNQLIRRGVICWVPYISLPNCRDCVHLF